MKQALYLKCALLLAMGGCAVADEVVVPPFGQEIHIQFDEPVVSLSTVENGGKKQASAADKGLELFDVTGDASFPPVIQWAEQDRLSISFPEGTSCHTEYRLSFKPGSARYLSRREMPQRDFLFHCPPSRLRGEGVPGMPGGAVLVLPNTSSTAESLSFSADSAVRYVFRRYESGRRRGKVVEEVPGVARPAQLKHGLPRPVLQRLAASKTADWASMGPDSFLPGVALVCPQSPLSAREDWKLVCNDVANGGGETEDGMAGENPAFQVAEFDVLFPQGRLDSSVRQEWDADAQRMLLTVAFSAPIPAEEVPQLFRRMRLQAVETPGAAGAAAGAIAEVAEDGMSQSLVSGGKTYRFTLLPTPAPNPFDSRPVRLAEPRPADTADTAADTTPGGQEEEAPQQRISYLPQGQVQRFSMLVEAPGPLTLDVSLPAGTRAVLGLEQEEEHIHRLSLNPAWPALDEVDQKYLSQGLCSLPLKGKHIVRLRTLNLESLTATLHHLPAAAAGRVVKEMESFSSANRASAQWAEARYRHALLQAQRQLGLPVSDKELEEAGKVVDSRRAVKENLEFCIKNLLSGSQAAAPCAIRLSPSSALLHSEEVALDVDALAGGKATPGLYVLQLQSVAAHQGKEGGLPDDGWGQTSYYLLQVSDLNLTISSSQVLVTRLSDASAVEEAELLFYPRKDEPFSNPEPQRVPVAKGLADVRPLSGSGHVQVISGDDSFILLTGRHFSPGHAETGEPRVSLVTDRDLYRPGETVHLRGVLRYVDAAGRASLPRARESVSLSVKKPNGETLLSRKLVLDEYGAFSRDFTLPEGEEDVTGSYTVELKAGGKRYSHSVLCQIFRRDAFHAEMELEMARVAPERWTLHVRAQDYNGSPLSGGKVSLRFQGAIPIHLAQDGQQDSGGEQEEEMEQEVELHLGADGTATLSGQVGALERGEGSLFLTGSVANDREEYVVLPAVEASCTSADFTIRMVDGSLRLFPSAGMATDKDSTGGSQPLPRAQKVQVCLKSPVWVTTPLPGGIILWKEEDMEVWRQEVEVPANCHDGVPLGLASVWKSFKESHPGAEQPMLIASGTDAAGRTAQLEQRYWPPSEYPDATVEPGLQYREGNQPGDAGSLAVELTLPQGGNAHIILTSPAGTRLVTRQVQAGKNSFTLPLEAGEEGTLSLSLLLPMPDADGAFHSWLCAQGQVEVPRRGAELSVMLDMPETPLRPGTPIRLSGRVHQEGNAPAAPAAVTLYAVDAGMLSVSDYSCPDWLRLFTESRVSAFMPPWNQQYRRDVNPGHQRWDVQLMGPIWPGVRIRPDGSLVPDSYPHSLFWSNLYPSAAGILYKGRSAKRLSTSRNAAMAEATGFAYEPPASDDDMAAEAAPAPCIAPAQQESGADSPPLPRVNFNPVAFWFPALITDADGHFSTEAALPDTLTTYRVFALALGKDGKHFGKAEGSFTVNQPLMLTPGTPLFMSTGDTLRLPLTITNNTEQDGTWQVTFPGETTPQRIQLRAHETATLYGDYTAATEGDCTLGWSAAGMGDNRPQDAVEVSFPVRFPAPLLKENHHLVLQPGQTPVDLKNLLAPELASSSRGKMEVALSANPLLHLQGCMDLLLSYPYGCTEQIAHGLLPWLLHGRLAPFNPAMSATSPEKARQTVAGGIGRLLARQQRDGGLSYWEDGHESCFWASAQAALVLTLAQEEGVPVPPRKLDALRSYLTTTYRQLEKAQELSPFTRYAIGRACGDAALATAALSDALKEEAKGQEARPLPAMRWLRTRQSAASLRFLAALQKTNGTDGADRAEETHTAFLEWLRVAAHDYRHSTTWDSGWMLLALHEYLLSLPPADTPARVQLEDGTELSLGQGATRLAPPDFSHPGSLQATEGTVYATVKAQAQPEKTDYPGITEKGLQVTRLYEKKGKDGIWRQATEFKAGDVVRITLTCAKAAPELEYFVLEDYLPSCMEAINPAVPSQAAGLEWQPWSPFVDHKEFLADRVRGFCTRWGGEGLLNMSYYARVKRAGTSTAPPAQAQLMYEPQIYGLSGNLKIQSQ